MGSFTSPPCAENVVWFIVEEVLPLGATQIDMIRNALLPDGKTLEDLPENRGISNRDIMPIVDRKVMFFNCGA